MTKSEKNVLADVVGMLNALVTSNSDGVEHVDQPAPANEEPSQEEIEFMKQFSGCRIGIVDATTINFTNHTVGELQISPDAFGRLINAYLEKYDHE